MYAWVTVSRDYPTPPRPGTLHLSGTKATPAREGEVLIQSRQEFDELVASYQGIGRVQVYDSRFPQRGCDLEKFLAKYIRKLWA